MKISKSKQELARIISENGGWRDGATWAIQHGTDRVAFTGRKSKPSWDKSCCCWGGDDFFGGFTYPKIYNYHQTILSRDEYFHLYPAPDADGWVEWNGGDECPVGGDTVVEIKTRDGEIQIDQACAWNWSHERGSPVKDRQIISYRLHNPEQAKLEFCESVMRSIPEPSDKPTIEQLATDYRNLLDLAQRKQEEADAAKADAEAKLAELVAAGKALGLVLSVACPEPELVIADWRDLRVLRVLDEVECVEPSTNPDKYIGMIGRLIEIDERDQHTTYLVDFGGRAEIWCRKVKFIRRP